MFTSAQAATLINKINVAFDKIGHHNGTSMPPSTNNSDPVAWEYFIAQHLSRVAEGRKKKAQAAAVAAGVIFDHEAEPRAPGDYSLYTSDILSYSCNVKNPTTKIDPKKLISALTALGVDTVKLNKAVIAATVTSKAAHTFSGALRTE